VYFGDAAYVIDRDGTKPGHARGVRYRGESPAGKARCGILPSVVSITFDARGKTMGLSYRTFLIARDDTIWRLSGTKFDRMLRDPASHCLPVFAGQRARMASAAVVLPRRLWSSTSACRRPCCSTGRRMDPAEMGRQAVRSRQAEDQPENYTRDVALSGIASIFKEADRPAIVPGVHGAWNVSACVFVATHTKSHAPT
jgi:hypothetical protein